MKILKSVLICICFLSPYFGFAKDNLNIEKKAIAQRARSYYGRAGRRGGIRFRFYVGPRYYRRGYYYRNYDYDYYYSQVSINIRENVQEGEKVSNVFIDGYRIRLRASTPSGNRGLYYYRVNPGYHLIEWTVQLPYGKTKRQSYNFYVDRYTRYTNISIDGDQIFIN